MNNEQQNASHIDTRAEWTAPSLAPSEKRALKQWPTHIGTSEKVKANKTHTKMFLNKSNTAAIAQHIVHNMERSLTFLIRLRETEKQSNFLCVYHWSARALC